MAGTYGAVPRMFSSLGNASSDSSGDSPFTSSEEHVLRISTLVPSSLSLIGSATMVLFLLRKGGFNLRLLLCLSLSDMFANAIAIISLLKAHDSSSGACHTLGFLVTYTELCPILWTACISLCLFLSVFAKRHTGKKGVHYFWYYFVFCFGGPAIPSVIGSMQGDYGDAGYGLCWVEDPEKRLYYFYVPLWAIILFNTVVYVSVTRAYVRGHLAQYGSLLNKPSGNSRINRLRYYPTILVVCWCFGSVRRVIQAFDSGIEIFPLYVLHTIFSRLQGLLNVLVYGTDPLQQLYPWVLSWWFETPPETPLPYINADPDDDDHGRETFTSSL